MKPNSPLITTGIISAEQALLDEATDPVLVDDAGVVTIVDELDVSWTLFVACLVVWSDGMVVGFDVVRAPFVAFLDCLVGKEFVCLDPPLVIGF
jgi:hypothetical protein